MDFRKHPEQYRVGVGEQGVLLVEPYKSEILPYWKFKTPEIALKSAKKIYQLFRKYKLQKDFIGMDMARKFLQMGYTRSRRYANHSSGQKYDSTGHILPFKNDPIKAQSAEIFKEYWTRAENDSVYAKQKESWKQGAYRLMTLCLMVFGLTACQNAVEKAARNVEYSAYEVVGVEKRDLLKKRVDKARDEQKEAGEDFEDALTRLKKVYSFEGGKLEKEYNRLNDAYEEASEQTKDVHQSIIRVETVAKDLFDEWEKELQQIQTENLRAKSRQQLQATRNKYSEMHEALKRSEAKMDPVLNKLKDHVLYLKHNLNAQAIASLKGEAGKIQGDIENLIKDMNRSIESADQFIKSIE